MDRREKKQPDEMVFRPCSEMVKDLLEAIAEAEAAANRLTTFSLELRCLLQCAREQESEGNGKSDD